MAPALTALAAVQARIAEAAQLATGVERVGRFTLREAQRDTLAAIRHALREFGGALVADAPGSGKTVLALAAAAEYEDVLVLAPAALREQWRRAAADAALPVRFASFESLSRGASPALASAGAATLLIADEAHHLRTPTTARYRAVATLARGRHLLLLSATPVVNRPRDRDALLALFLGARAAEAGAAVIERVVLRRSTQQDAWATVQRLPPLPTAADLPGLAAMIATLPPAFPLADGTAATALVRLALAMAWSSSLAALAAALRRRLQRGEVLLDRLLAGHWPSRDALRTWLHGDDATQLALPLATADLPQAAPAGAVPILRTHLVAVSALRAHIADHVERDTQARADALRALLRRERPRRIVLLAHHAETVRALYHALRGEPGVVAITGARVYAAAGRWSREEVLTALGPRAAPWSAQDTRGIRLLLATDLLAEGVELQGCATMVHGDPAWTPARLEQRVGRVARDGQRAPVHVTHFRLPPDVQPLLALGRRLRQKRLVRREALAHADATALLHQRLHGWSRAQPSSAGTLIAAALATHCGFLAVLRDERSDATLLVGGRHGKTGWRVSQTAALLAPLVASVGESCAMDAHCVATARRLLRHWLQRRRVQHALGDATGIAIPLLRRVRLRLSARTDAAPLALRQARAAEATTILTQLAALRGVGAERLVLQALREKDVERCVRALQALRGADRAHRPTVTAPPPSYRLSALLLLRRPTPDAPAPPAPSTGSAAIR